MSTGSSSSSSIGNGEIQDLGSQGDELPDPNSGVGIVAAATARSRNTLDEIQNSPALKLRLRLWQTEDELLRERIEQKEQSLTKTQNEIYQLFGIFAVFQGVVLTALAEASNLECGKWWIPLILTIFAGAAVTFAVWYKLQQCDKIHREVDLEKANSRAVQLSMQMFVGLGADYDEGDMQHQPNVVPPAKGKKMLKWKISIVSSILVFTALMAMVCRLILC